jgi:inactivated superfamily I helicase
MPVKKYKYFEEASDALWVLEPNAEYFQKLREINLFWSKLNRTKIKKGIQKFKTYEDFLKMKDKFDS